MRDGCGARAVDETAPRCGVRNDVSSTSDAEPTSRAEAISEARFKVFNDFTRSYMVQY